MPRIALSTSTPLGALAAQPVAAAGGTAVDAAIAAAALASVTEPGVISLAASGFITVWPPGGDPLMIDGAAVMPGRGLPASRLGGGGRQVHLAYGGGMHTVVGHGSVAVPGIIAAYDTAWRRYGHCSWAELWRPAIEHAHAGFPLSQASYDYLRLTHEGIFGWNPHSFAALHDADGGLFTPGDTIRIDHLSDSLESIARDGARSFYQGDLARAISDDVLAGGGVLTRADLAAYSARTCDTLNVELDHWQVATNPPPAVGGVALAAMLLLLGTEAPQRQDAAAVRLLADIQHGVLRFRRERIDPAKDPDGEAGRLLERAQRNGLNAFAHSPSTVHVSAVDSDGLACAITLSAGYGSGVMPSGTGIWLNNSLGELELNRRGLHGWPVGARLPSNMAPTVARRADGEMLAIGSPGADRITTAIFQTLVQHMHWRRDLQSAIDYPRLHVEFFEGQWQVAHEPGLPMEEVRLPQRRFDGLSMYFGGVSAASASATGDLQAAADPRRAGSTQVGGG